MERILYPSSLAIKYILYFHWGLSPHFLPLSVMTLQVKRLKKTFGPHTVFSDLSFEYSGNTLGIAGSNGSGKSTLLKCLAGLLSPTEGEVNWLENNEIISGQIFNQSMGYAAPYINLYDELTVIENLQFLSDIRRHTDSAGNIKKWINKTGLSTVEGQPFGTLSTGQQQRLRIAAALFHQPDILLLDEPGSNLDETGRSLVNEIANLYQDPRHLLIIASNDPRELEVCQQIFTVERQQFI